MSPAWSESESGSGTDGHCSGAQAIPVGSKLSRSAVPMRAGRFVAVQLPAQLGGFGVDSLQEPTLCDEVRRYTCA